MKNLFQLIVAVLALTSSFGATTSSSLAITNDTIYGGGIVLSNLTAGAVVSVAGSGQKFLTNAASASTLGNGSSATYTLTIDLSGTDVAWTHSSGAVSVNSPFTVSSGDLSVSSGNIFLPSSYNIRFSGASRIANSSDGVVVLYDNAATSFNRLQFGGTSASFPALKRSSNGLQVRLADDSGFAPLTLGAPNDTTALTVTGGSVTGSGTTPFESHTGTWNTSGSPIGKRNIITNTASGASARFETWETEAGEKFSIDKNGKITFGTYGGGVGMIGVPYTAGVFLGRADVGYQLFVGYSSAHLVSLPSEGRLGWSATSYTGNFSSQDTYLTRSASGTVNVETNLVVNHLATKTAAPTVASAATIAPTSRVSFVSGTTTIDTITAPSPISSTGGQITLIPTGLWSTSTSGNIALATTAVVNRVLTLTYDATTTKWYPSY